MAIHPWQTNFWGGEFTPALYARTDLQRYTQGASCLTNFIVLPQGGASRRAGTNFIYETKDSTKKARLLPFVFNQDQAYCIEAGVGYFRFYTDRAILRNASVNPALSMTLSALVGFNITLTAGAAFFTDTATDKGRTITFASGGRLTIESVSSTTVATGRVLTNFVDLVAASGNWTVTGTVVEVATPYTEADLFQLRFRQSADTMYVVHPNYAPRKLVRSSATVFSFNIINFDPPASVQSGISPATNLTLSATSGNGITVTASGSTWLAADADRLVTGSGGRMVLRTITSATVATADVLDPFPSTALLSPAWILQGSPNADLTVTKKDPVGAKTTLTLSREGWRATDVGAFARVSGGQVKITQINSTTVAEGVIQSALAALNVNPAFSWTLEFAAWSAGFGFPNVVDLYEQRAWYAGTARDPLTVWGSRVGDFENFAAGSADDASVRHLLVSGEVNIIRWMRGVGSLNIGTIGAEHRFTGGTDKPITPLNVLAKSEGNVGCDFDVDALRLGGSVIFPQRGGRKLNEYSPDETIDRWTSKDITVVSEHLFRVRMRQIDRASSPDSFILAVMADGSLNVCTFVPSERIAAWAPQTTQGLFESTCVIPNDCGDGDEVWTLVNRTIQGSTKRYVELFDGGLTTDSAGFYSGTPTNHLRGLQHLEGQSVKAVIVNGALLFTEAGVVTNGEIAFANAGSSIQVGLSYTPTCKTLRVDFGDQVGSIQTRLKRISKVGVRVFSTHRITIDGEVCSPAHGTMAPGTPFTGDIEREARLGWDDSGVVTISTDLPLPITVLGISPAVAVEDG